MEAYIFWKPVEGTPIIIIKTAKSPQFAMILWRHLQPPWSPLHYPRGFSVFLNRFASSISLQDTLSNISEATLWNSKYINACKYVASIALAFCHTDFIVCMAFGAHPSASFSNCIAKNLKMQMSKTAINCTTEARSQTFQQAWLNSSYRKQLVKKNKCSVGNSESQPEQIKGDL